MEQRSTLYSYAIIAQPIHEQVKGRCKWQKAGKYKQLRHAEKALKDFTADVVATHVYRIVPYFDAYWWIDEETMKSAYIKSNGLLWEFLGKRGLADEAREYVQLNGKEETKSLFF